MAVSSSVAGLREAGYNLNNTPLLLEKIFVKNYSIFPFLIYEKPIIFFQIPIGRIRPIMAIGDQGQALNEKVPDPNRPRSFVRRLTIRVNLIFKHLPAFGSYIATVFFWTAAACLPAIAP